MSFLPRLFIRQGGLNFFFFRLLNVPGDFPDVMPGHAFVYTPSVGKVCLEDPLSSVGSNSAVGRYAPVAKKSLSPGRAFSGHVVRIFDYLLCSWTRWYLEIYMLIAVKGRLVHLLIMQHIS